MHISAFPRDGSRPVEGKSLSYELGRGSNGKPQAVRVIRQAIGLRPPQRAGAEAACADHPSTALQSGWSFSW